jgi:hypothetical protein
MKSSLTIGFCLTFSKMFNSYGVKKQYSLAILKNHMPYGQVGGDQLA